MSIKPEYPELMPGFRWQDIDADGVRIRAAVGGAGPPLLLLHGPPQTHLTWHKVVPALANRFTVISPDLPVFGDSDNLPGQSRAATSYKLTTADRPGQDTRQ